MVGVGALFAFHSSTRSSLRASEPRTICPTSEHVRVTVLSADVQEQLRTKFGAWKIQGPADLSTSARERWSGEKPLECPGIAAGAFHNGKARSFAVLMIHANSASSAYKFLVFIAGSGTSSYDVRTVEESNDDGRNMFIRRVAISQFFDRAS
jgi:hypothetical protein